ncbi:hypothetical protein [Paraburkholderia sp. WSM4175]|uniref:hypothetical protein n=1 Tax=Paraburkholderia sp. WSM4175 TaxID=2991072 RepID=UPI003D1D92E6
MKLVKVSVDALRSGVPTYDRSRLHGFLLSKAGIARQKQIVAEAYGGYATRSSGAEKELVSNVRWVWFPHYRAMCEARAVNLCALLAALDLPNPKEADLAERWPQVPTVGRARVFMLRHARLFPGARPSRGTGIHYWVLRLLDPNWLTRHFRGKKAVPAPPSISEDRAWIKQYMAGKRRRKEVRTDQRTLLVRSAAFLRAQVRDQSWLRNECPDIAWSHRPRDRITSDKSRKSTRRAPPPMTVKHVRALRDAFRAALLEEGYPAPLTVTELAARARLGYDNAKKALRHDPRFQVEIQHARGELRHRRILWAAHELQVRDGPMTVTAIASCAHIRNNKASSELIRRVLGDLVEKGN